MEQYLRRVAATPANKRSRNEQDERAQIRRGGSKTELSGGMTATRSWVRRSSVTKGMAGEGTSEMAPGMPPGEVVLEEFGEPIPPWAGDWMPSRTFACCGVGWAGASDSEAADEEQPTPTSLPSFQTGRNDADALPAIPARATIAIRRWKANRLTGRLGVRNRASREPTYREIL